MAQVKISGLPTGTASTAIEIPATDPNDLSTPTGKTFKYTLSDITTVTGAVANGGTGANAVGANGTLAQSDGTKYTFTTATYPGTATNTNHLMRADGTNWVASTNTQLTSNDELSGLTKLDVDNIEINGNVISSTDANGNLQLNANGTGQVEVDDPGLETGGILVDGASFNTAFRVNDIGGIAPAQVILHKHSTSLEPILLGARSNSNTSAHATVTNGMPVLNMYGTGWLNSYYGTMASITFSADATGTLADGSAPGRLQFNVTPDGALLPVTAMTINNNGVVTLANALPVGSGGTGRTTATAYAVLCGGTTSTGAQQSVASVGTSNQILASNGAGALPAFKTLNTLTTAPTVTTYTSGSGTYTTPAGVKYLIVELVGAGGGGAGSGAGAGDGSNGGNTTFGTATANGGNAGLPSGGAGGGASGGTINLAGGMGNFGGGLGVPGALGGSSYFAGGGAGGNNAAGNASNAPANTGAGGGGAGGSATVQGAYAGGAGGYVRWVISSPSATYSYGVGAGGAGGAAGTSGGAGGSGAEGLIIVTEYYQ